MSLPRPPLPLPLPLRDGNRPDKFPHLSTRMRLPVIFLSSKSVRNAESRMGQKHPLYTQTSRWRTRTVLRYGPINNPLILVNTGKSIFRVCSLILRVLVFTS